VTDADSRMIFVNPPVRDLDRAKAFVSRLGFAFNPRFTDDKAACMIVSHEASVMLLIEPFFRTFTNREPCDTRTHVEGFLALSCGSRGEVEDMVRTAPPAAVAQWTRKATDSCTAGASATPTGTGGRSCGWTRRLSALEPASSPGEAWPMNFVVRRSLTGWSERRLR
jgi:uncharacterized protein